MANTAVERELIDLEKRYWQALEDRDVATTVELTDDTCIVAGAQGVGRIDKPSLEKMVRGAGWALRDFELKDVQVKLLGEDVAIIAYKVRETVTVDGKDLTLEAADASTWVRRDGRWVCALHTESLAGDPFGRDRRAA